MPELVVVCHACAASARYQDVVPRRAECESCGAELHCCRNCRFYDETAYNECREPVAERVVDKAAANFCDYFRPAEASGERTGAGGPAHDELERLFRKS